MKGCTSWSYTPYRPLLEERGEIYICRLAPGKGRITLDWLPMETGARYTVRLRLRGTGTWQESCTQETTYTWTGLEDGQDYEVTVCGGGHASAVRLARTGVVPGDSVVNYLHPEDPYYAFSGQYLCSPSFLVHPDGYLLASMDVFGHNTPQNLSLIYRSDDGGMTWKYQCDLYPCFWGKLFYHCGAVYMLSVNTEYGDLLIGRSDDGGKSFGVPTVLLRGSAGFKVKGVHKNPQPVVAYDGRLWITLEWGSWASGGHAAMCGSVDENADLCDASSWAFTPPLPHNPAWPGAEASSASGIEGCLTVGLDGKLYNMLRYSREDRAILHRVHTEDPEASLSFEHFVDFPGSGVKFQVKYDPVSRMYLSIVNYRDETIRSGRRVLSLIASPDREHWSLRKHIFDYRHEDEKVVGFQYVDFEMVGEDILFLTRVAYNGAANYHDANYSVFSRIRDFRVLL